MKQGQGFQNSSTVIYSTDPNSGRNLESSSSSFSSLQKRPKELGKKGKAKKKKSGF